VHLSLFEKTISVLVIQITLQEGCEENVG